MCAGKMVEHAGASDESGVVQDAEIRRGHFNNSRLVVGGPVRRDHDGRWIERLIIITIGVIVVGLSGISVTVHWHAAMDPSARDIAARHRARSQNRPSLGFSDGKIRQQADKSDQQRQCHDSFHSGPISLKNTFVRKDMLVRRWNQRFVRTSAGLPNPIFAYYASSFALAPFAPGRSRNASIIRPHAIEPAPNSSYGRARIS